MLSTKICDVKLDNPTILASGIFGVTGKLLVRAVNNGAGAVILKTLTLEERTGHKNPTVLAGDDYIINAVGLSNPGVKQGIKEIEYAKKHTKAPVIASISGKTVKEFGIISKEISKARPDFIEVNISCPNVEDELGKPFACSIEDASSVTKAVKTNTKIPVIIKLSPNVNNIGEIAANVEKAGADVISAINTVGPEKNEFLANKSGGISGPKIRKIALEKVKEITANVKIPVIGIGGITYGKDAVEMLKIGASAVQVGSALHFRGYDAFKKICNEIKEYMKENKFSSLKELIGYNKK